VTAAAPAEGPAGDDRQPALHRPGRGELLWYKAAWNITFVPCRLLWHISVSGRHNVPRDRPFILAPVHRSYLDTLVAAYVSRDRLRFMAKEEIFAKPWAARLFSSLGGFPVRRGTADRDALRLCEQVLAGGEPLVLFPEGTRRTGPVVEDLFGGAAFVALRANVPIVPVGIGGSDRALPPGARMVHLARIAVVVGEPIYPPARTGAGRVPRNAVDEVTRSLQASLQALYDEARARAEG
jgi:1-acyl-sn-glycerol-3-phosphate acyltransferase